MSDDRNSLWQTLWQIFQSNPFWVGLLILIFQQNPLRPWVRATFVEVRNALAAILALGVGLLRSYLRIAARLRRRTARGRIVVTPLTGSIIVTPLTGSIIVSVITTPPAPPSLTPFGLGPDRFSPPRLANNSMMMAQLEAAQRQQDASFAIRSTMPGFSAATLQ
jgi:predicted permease